MKIFITGAGGFLGKHLARELIKKGHELTSVSRGDYPELREMGIHCFQGDLQDSSLLNKIMAGHDACFHIASKVGMWGKPEDFYQTNIIGTENIIASCFHNRISALIYTSSPSVIFGADSLKGVDEKTPYPSKFLGHYAQTKSLAEQAVLKANNKQLKTVSLRPHLIFGPGDRNLIPGLLKAARANRLKIVGDGKNLVDMTYIDNAVSAHIKAFEIIKNHHDPMREKIAGEAFFIGQGPVNLWDTINTILEHHELSPITKKIPFKLAYFIGSLTECFLNIFKIFNYTPAMTRFIALQLAKDHYYNHDKAHKLLGWKPQISILDGIKSLEKDRPQ